MTVKIMPDGTAAAVVSQEASTEEMPPQVNPAPTVYEPSRTVNRRRRATGSVGDVLLVQLLISVTLAAGVWAGSTFGGEDIRSLCLRIAELFR